MKQLFLQKGKVFLEDVPPPLLQENNVLVEVCYSYISSGTELATISQSEKSLVNKFVSNSSENVKKVLGAVKADGVLGTIALVRGKLKNITELGYSCSGKVVGVGKKVEKVKVGDFVACAGAGFANHAQLVSVPANLITKVNDSNYLKQASLTTVGSIAMQGVRRAKLNLGEKVCVFGLGLIGQITAQLCKISGCQVIGIDIKKDRLKLAKKLGADFVFDGSDEYTAKHIDFVTNHLGVDATIITASSPSGYIIDRSMQITRKKGRVVLVGDVRLDFDRENFYSKEIDFLISCSYGPGRYDNSYEIEGKDYPYHYVRWTENRNLELFVDLIEKKAINLDHLTKDEFDICYAQNAYSYLKNKKSLGVVLSFNNSKKNLLEDISESLNSYTHYGVGNKKDFKGKVLRALDYCAPKSKITTGFLGVGGFAKVKLLPLFSKNKNVDIKTIVDTNTSNMINTARVYDAKLIGNRSEKLFSDEDINLVVIATPHKFHFEQSIKAMSLGKAVFLEKPAAVNFKELEKLDSFFKKNKNCFYCVDFNRSFAKFNVSIKNELSKRKSPAIINYRMNAGYISKDHWIQSKENGGRIIGEACHIFELFCFLTDSQPKSVNVQPLNNLDSDIFSTDNFIATVSMKDGSCCSLTYTSLGDSRMGKENMEVFFDGKSILMQDYKTLKGFGLSRNFNKKTSSPDKGHRKLISEFLKGAKTSGSFPPVPIQRILTATKLSLIVDKLARQGGGFESVVD